MDFEDMLRKAMENEMKENSADETEKDPSEFMSNMNGIVSILGMGSLVKLAKAAQFKMTETIRNLTEDLNSMRNDEDKAYYHSKAGMKIEKACKTIKILNLIITTSAIMGTSSIGSDDLDESAKKSLDMILRLTIM